MTPKAVKLSEREYLCLEYLTDKMESDAHRIGQFIRVNSLNPRSGGTNFISIGGAVVGRLRRRGMVTFLPDLKAWRITPAGRAALASDKGDGK